MSYLRAGLLASLCACAPVGSEGKGDASEGESDASEGEGEGEGEGDSGEGEGDASEGEGEGETGIDADHDGLDDGREAQLARDGLPFLSNHPDDECLLSGIAFRARPHPDDATLVHIVYTRLYQNDCGIDSHPGDNEAFGVTLDPATPGPLGIVAVKAISHQNTLCQRTTECGRCGDLDACDEDPSGRPILYSSKNKHGGVVDLELGCGITACLEQCEPNDVSAAVPLLNVGEPDAHLVSDLTDGADGTDGFVTAANGWTDAQFFHFDPWSDVRFGDAGKPSEDLVDDAFVPTACHVASEGEGEGEGEELAPEDAFVERATYVPSGSLCALPDASVVGADEYASGSDPVHPACDVEVDNTIAPRDSLGASVASLHVVAWNVEMGRDHAAVLDALAAHPDLAGADVILLTEVARHDGESVPAGINQARELALALGMNYAFAVQWDRRYVADALVPAGEHGGAILARFPIGDAAYVRHTPANNWWDDEQLIGGRITLGATLRLDDAGTLLRVNASHFCTRPLAPMDADRAVQGAEARAFATSAGRPHRALVGGDFNTWTCNPANNDCTTAPDAEQVVTDFLASGWRDATAGWNGVSQLGEGFFPQRLDWVFARGPVVITPGQAIDVEGSDHLPLAFDVAP